MKKLCLLLLAVTFSLSSAWAQRVCFNYEPKWKEDNRHSVSLSVGSYPIIFRYLEDVNYMWNSYDGTPPPYGSGLITSDNILYKSGEISAPSFNLAYAYRINKALSIECVGAYTNQTAEHKYIFSDLKEGFTSRCDIFFFMPNLRAYWYVSDRCELYSAIALGAGYARYSNHNGVIDNNFSKNYISAHICPIGINYNFSRVYAFGEFGLGCLGSRVGIGYKF